MQAPSQIKESECDLLIIGAGPAGLMAAAWASRYGVSTRIIDKKSTRTVTGHADGLQCRTLEILDSFGLAHSIVSQSCREVEICSWNPDESGQIQRTQRLLSQRIGTSRYQQTVINQGLIEQNFLDFFEKDGNIIVDRSVVPESLSFDEACGDDKDARPITVTLRHLDEDEATEVCSSNYGAMSKETHNITTKKRPQTEHFATKHERIKAKYMIGCDGAHSWTRKQLGIQLEGEQSDFLWGVMDIVPLTNFPDIRHPCAVHSNNGSVMMVPRENRLVRLYIQITKADAPGGRLDRSQTTLDNIFRAAQKVLLPYYLEYKYCDWWSVYQIGQRVAPRFSQGNRLFLAGDAIHTHSPKVGQGMNVSMQDTYNLGWKICSVITGRANPRILRTYELERRQVALDLIKTDYETSQFYSSSKKRSNKDHQALRDKFYLFLSGVAVDYSHSALTVQAASNAEAEDASTDEAIGEVDSKSPTITKPEEAAVAHPSPEDKTASDTWNPSRSNSSSSLAFSSIDSPPNESAYSPDQLSTYSAGSTAPSLNGTCGHTDSPMESSTTSIGTSVSGSLDFNLRSMESSASSIHSFPSEKCLHDGVVRQNGTAVEHLNTVSPEISSNSEEQASREEELTQKPLHIGSHAPTEISIVQDTQREEVTAISVSESLRDTVANDIMGYGPPLEANEAEHSPDLLALQNDVAQAGVVPASEPTLATNIKLGVRLTPYQVLNQSDAAPTHLSTLLLSTGNWRLLVFGGDIRKESQLERVRSLGAELAKPTSVLRKYTPDSAAIDSLIEVVTVHSAPREEVELLDLPDVYHPWDNELGWDYWKVFSDCKALDGTYDDVYTQFGIDREQGCIVLCRPDQHVAYIGALESSANLTAYFDNVVM